MRRALVLALFGTLVLDAAQAPGQQPLPASGSADAEEELLCERSAKDFWGPPSVYDETVSPDLSRIAWLSRRPAPWTLVVNGQPVGPRTDEHPRPAFSPDGAHIARTGREGKTWRVWVDGQAVAGPFDEVRHVRFAPDGRVTFAARQGTAWTLQVGDEPHRATTDEIAFPALVSPDGKRVAHVIKRSDGMHVVLDGTVGPAFELVVPAEGYMQPDFPSFEPVGLFSPDSRRFAYVGIRKDTMVAVVEGREQAHPGVLWPTFSPDSARFAYVAVAFPSVTEVQGLLGFKPRLERETTPVVGRLVVEGSTIATSDPAFTNLRVRLRVKQNTLRFGGFWAPFNDPGWVAPVSAPVFLPDGKVVYSLTRRLEKGNAISFTDALFVEGEPSHRVQAQSLEVKLTPVQASELAYVEKPATGFASLVVRGAEPRSVPGASNAALSPDLKHVGYQWHVEERKGSQVVLDDRATRVYDDILARPRFVSPTSLAFVARVKEGEVYRYYRVTLRSMAQPQTQSSDH